jgi:hypothetical protein
MTAANPLYDNIAACLNFFEVARSVQFRFLQRLHGALA